MNKILKPSQFWRLIVLKLKPKPQNKGNIAHRKRLRRALQDPEPENGREAVGDRGAGGHGRPDETGRDGGGLAADDVHRSPCDEAAGTEQDREAEGRQQS